MFPARSIGISLVYIHDQDTDTDTDTRRNGLGNAATHRTGAAGDPYQTCVTGRD